MRAMAILDRCRAAAGRMRSIDERERRLRDSSRSITVSYERVGGRSKAGSDAMAELMERLDALACERRAEHRIYEAELLAANAALDRLPEAERAVLYRYYILGQSAPQIAKAIDRTRGTVMRLKASGVQQAQRISVDLPEWYLRIVGDGSRPHPTRTDLASRIEAEDLRK